ncbi:methylated-DNA--[protein]-cysteine S-methyltransferase [Pimelobacter simplex]|uniref:methylated-DNA--[protein]-cysteine S-methyltransferase n=1 Tax=Nocardioides simplex TaxID=2045 RepID=UPI003AAA808D
METRHTVVDTDLGPITLVATRGPDGDAVSGLYFRSHRRRPAAADLGTAVPVAEDPLLGEAATQLVDYLGGRRLAFELPLAAAGDAFQQQVWTLLGLIPRGTTTTYGEIAARLGDRSLAWQVGQAVGANPLCVIVPCHRVIGANGSLTGYAGGLRRKQALLALEEQDARVAGRLF